MVLLCLALAKTRRLSWRCRQCGFQRCSRLQSHERPLRRGPQGSVVAACRLRERKPEGWLQKWGKMEESGWHKRCVTAGDWEIQSREVSRGAGPLAFVEFLSSPSNPVNCFRCNELRLVFRLDGYVLGFHKKPARMFMNAGSQTQLPVPFGSKQETGWSLQAWPRHAPPPLQGYTQCGHLYSLARTRTLPRSA